MDQDTRDAMADKWATEAGEIMLTLITKGYTRQEGMGIMAIIVGTICYTDPGYKEKFNGYLDTVIDQMKKGDPNV